MNKVVTLSFVERHSRRARAQRVFACVGICLKDGSEEDMGHLSLRKAGVGRGNIRAPTLRKNALLVCAIDAQQV